MAKKEAVAIPEREKKFVGHSRTRCIACQQEFDAEQIGVGGCGGRPGVPHDLRPVEGSEVHE